MQFIAMQVLTILNNHCELRGRLPNVLKRLVSRWSWRLNICLTFIRLLKVDDHHGTEDFVAWVLVFGIHLFAEFMIKSVKLSHVALWS